MNIELNIKPLSVNEAWQGRRFKTDAYKSYETNLLFILPKSNREFKKEDMLRIEFVFGFSNVASDLDNPVKPTMDILSKKYGFNDRNVWELVVNKKVVVKGKEFINVTISDIFPF